MKKLKIEIKNRFTGKVLFEYESENNTIKKTIGMAVEEYADLGYADLRGADLRGADLRGADLRGANLRGADLRGADLRSADLRSANLRGANLRGADLRGANLIGADLRSANLRSADLIGADLRSANLRGADLRSANLRGADLRGANLRDANLSGADLRYADLSGANLRGANLSGADIKRIKKFITICPEEGSFVAWKKLSNNCLAKIEIPAQAKRTSCIRSRKCRASYIKTLNIWDSNGNEIKEQKGRHDGETIYRVGRLTKPNSYNDDIREECTHGIHFFITKQEALDW
jgi:uncharacterized protein YjbI with pentapeptide repeats